MDGKAYRNTLYHIVILFAAASASQLPYNPTKILLSPDSRTAYIFSPSAPSGQYSVLSLDLTQPLQGDKLPTKALFTGLTFSQNGNQTAFVPFIDHAGDVVVWAGDCTRSASASKVWRLALGEGSSKWQEEPLQLEAGESASLTGPGFLSTGITFQPNITEGSSWSSFYNFGGMCPNNTQTDTTASEQASATYSNLIPQLTTANFTAFNLQTSTSSRGRPISQAGHTLTGVIPSYITAAGGAQTMQQNFVLLGGHTATAFTNMSQIALFSLPQAAWSYMNIDTISAGLKTELVKMGDVISQVQPRSGHSAVLSNDGSKIVMFGGWVGDLDTPSNPQLAVLNIGSDYGGKGPWQWRIPASASSSQNRGGDIYGHAAIMLPGDIMMTIGGYSIASSSSKRKERRDGQQGALTAKFYNVSSDSWISQYSLSSIPGQSLSLKDSTSGPLSTTTEKAGLAAGLVAALLLVIGLYFAFRRYRHRLRDEREEKEAEIEQQSRGREPTSYFGSQTHLTDDKEALMPEVQTPPLSPIKCSSPDLPYREDWFPSDGHAATRTGALVEIPSPTRGLRRNVSGGSYPHLYGKRQIHPIMESQEETSSFIMAPKPTFDETTHQPKALTQMPVNQFQSQRIVSDPQKRALLPQAPAPSSPTLLMSQWDVMPGVMPLASGDLKPYDATLQTQRVGMGATIQSQSHLAPHANGPVSPSFYSDRTRSTLSDYSFASDNPSERGSTAISFGATGLGRTLSLHSEAILKALASTMGMGGSGSGAQQPVNIRPASSTESEAEALIDIYVEDADLMKDMRPVSVGVDSLLSNKDEHDVEARPLSYASSAGGNGITGLGFLETVPESPRPSSRQLFDREFLLEHNRQPSAPQSPTKSASSYLTEVTDLEASAGADIPRSASQSPTKSLRSHTRSPTKSLHSAERPQIPGRSISGGSTLTRSGTSLLSSVRRVLGVDRSASYSETVVSTNTTLVNSHTPTLPKPEMNQSAVLSLPSQQAITPRRTASDTINNTSRFFWRRRNWMAAPAEPSNNSKSPSSPSVSTRIAMYEARSQSPSTSVKSKKSYSMIMGSGDLEKELEKFARERRVVVAGAYMRPRENLRVVNADVDAASLDDGKLGGTSGGAVERDDWGPIW